MTDLKILKDIKMTYGVGESPTKVFAGLINYKQNLREEAIKWIKHLQESYNNWKEIEGKKPISDLPFVDYNEQEIIAFIKYFFNISDEDLK